MSLRPSLSRSPLTPIVAALFLVVACSKDDGAESTSGSLGHDPKGPDAPPAAGVDGGATQPQTEPTGGGGAGEDPAPPQPTEPGIQLVGRFDTRDAAGPKCGWPGCRIIARFNGTRVSVKLREFLEPWMDGGPSEWDVAVDGNWKPKIVTDATGAARDYVVAADLAAGTHVVELYKRSEAQDGTTQFLGYDFGGGTLLPPPARAARRLEIIGDSVVSGYGVEGVGQGPICPGPNWAARYENFHVSMGALLGEIFKAEVAGTVFAGKGVAQNVSPDDKETMPIIFGRALPDDGTSGWDFSQFVSNVVVVMLGGNDFGLGEPVDMGPATPAEFQTAYTAFAATLREKYPTAHLFLSVPPPLNDIEPPGRNVRTNVTAGVKAVAAERNAAGDARVYAFEPKPSDASEHTGCEGHGDPQYHQRVANELAAEIRARVGWK